MTTQADYDLVHWHIDGGVLHERPLGNCEYCGQPPADGAAQTGGGVPVGEPPRQETDSPNQTPATTGPVLVFRIGGAAPYDSEDEP